ncbi:MAG: DMT family transporter [Acidobacteriota bacterium]|nr:DMT family transporter [Acidobacteriota bacterium]
MTVSALGVLLILGSSLAYSTLDLLRKVLVARLDAASLLFYLSVGQLPFFAAWMLAEGSPSIEPAYYLPAGISVALNIAANLLFMEAVRVSPLSLTVPFLSLTPVFTAILGIPILGEMPGLMRWAGVLIVVLGASQLNLGAAGLAPRDVMKALGRERGSLLMVTVALCWSIAMPLDKVALTHASVAIHGFVLNAGVAAGMVVMLAARGRLSRLGEAARAWRLLSIGVLVSVVGLAFLLLALGYVWVAVAETLRRALGSVAALGIGRVVFEEPVTAAKALGVALMSAGVALILL